jgi:hypothetical protein
MEKEIPLNYIIIPQIVSSATAMIWVGASSHNEADAAIRKVANVRASVFKLFYIEADKFKNEADLLDNPEAGEYVLDDSEWRTWQTRHGLDQRLFGSGENQFFHYQRVTLGLTNPSNPRRLPLKPRTRYEVRLWVDNLLTVEDDDERFRSARAQFTTLPVKLPDEAENNTFKVMLGSCFYKLNDPAGTVGKTYHSLKPEERPEIKFLCGDQVYLDNPWWETTLNIISPFLPPERMRTSFFDKYIANWTQLGEDKDGDLCGFNLLLRDGANYFCSDDHEFWNNAPNWGIVGFANTLLRGQRSWWFREAGELYRVFQSLAPWMTFDVPPVSFCIVDSRINRLPGKKQFMEEDDLDAVQRWIQRLPGPGVLVMGQVLMIEKGRFWDDELPDYTQQYNKLKEYIKSSNHSIVYLTGDVHFGRVSICDLDRKKGTKFVEVVSSPMMVVSDLRGRKKIGKVEKSPEIFDTPVDCYAIADGQNHFVTLEFSKTAAGKVKMKVNTHRILDPDSKSDIVKGVIIDEKKQAELECKIPNGEDLSEIIL